MRGHGLAAVTDALAEHEAADETRDTGVDVHHRAAGEVDRTPLEDQARVGGDLVDFELGCGFRVRCRSSQRLGGADGRSRAGPVPDHVRDGEIDQRHPERDEKGDGAELHALGQGADDERRRDGRERHLEGDIDELGDNDAVGEGLDGRIHRHARQERFREAADEAVEGAAFGEGQAVAVDDPDHADDGDRVEHLHQHGEHVLGADETAVEQGEARHGHHEHERRRREHPRRVALVRGRGVGREGRGSRQKRKRRGDRQNGKPARGTVSHT